MIGMTLFSVFSTIIASDDCVPTIIRIREVLKKFIKKGNSDDFSWTTKEIDLCVRVCFFSFFFFFFFRWGHLCKIRLTHSLRLSAQKIEVYVSIVV